MLQKSEENSFLYNVLRPHTISNIRNLWKMCRDLYKEAISPSDEGVKLAAKEWSKSTEEVYVGYNFSILTHPIYTEIHEHLGIYGQTQLERKLRRLKRITRRRWNGFCYGIIQGCRWTLLGRRCSRAYWRGSYADFQFRRSSVDADFFLLKPFESSLLWLLGRFTREAVMLWFKKFHDGLHISDFPFEDCEAKDQSSADV